MLVVAYPLSIGPIVWLDNHNFFDRWPAWALWPLSLLYFPLGWLCEMIPALETLLEWYVGLWDS